MIRPRLPSAAASAPTPALLAGLLLGAAALAACGASDAGSSGETRSTAVDRWRGVVLDSAVARPAFTFTDTRGEPYDFREETRGRVALLFFGFTHCPDVCPVQLANLGAVLEELPPGLRSRIEVVFVSVDPERDDRERIRRWLDRFGEGFVGLRAPEDSVAALQRRLGLPPSGGRQPTDDGGYTVGHAAQLLAFTPDGYAHLAYPFGTRQRDWAHDLERLARDGWDGP